MAARTRTLALIRHAHTPSVVTGQPDSDRKLDALGEAQAAASRQWWMAYSHIPWDRALVSPATRTQQTAHLILKPALPTLALETEPAIYLATRQRLWTLLHHLPETHTHVIIVGHNPALSELATHFSRGLIELTPASIVIYTFELDTWATLETTPATWIGGFIHGESVCGPNSL